MTETVVPYRDASRPVDERVADLLARMTRAEKIAQLGSFWAFEIVGELLGARHPPEEVRGPVFDGHGGIAIRIAHGGHPFTDPAVSPPTSWRSATR